jgi:hypothetical protein
MGGNECEIGILSLAEFERRDLVMIVLLSYTAEPHRRWVERHGQVWPMTRHEIVNGARDAPQKNQLARILMHGSPFRLSDLVLV